MSIGAQDLAIQTNRGAVQVVAQAEMAWDGPRDELVEAFAISEAVWVQHFAGNRSVRVMTER